MTSEHERALAGACLLDDAIARLVLAEVQLQEIADPTARLVLWAIMRGFEADELLADDPTWDRDEPAILTDLEGFAMTLECAGKLEEAGGAVAVAALVEDRPALREALAAGRRALTAMVPVEDEVLVIEARALLGGVA